MSKKDKSKFRRRLRAEILKQMSTASRIEKTPALVDQTMAEPDIKPEPSTAEAPASQSIPSDTLQLVRLDLKKGAIIIGSIIILIIALYLIDMRTDILLEISDKMF